MENTAMKKKSSRIPDYHDFVIKDGELIGKFEEMYRKCADPWPETEKDLDANPVSCYCATLIRKNRFKRLFSVGIGKGLHANWLLDKVSGLEVEGCEISKTAVEYAQAHYPKIKSHCLDAKEFLKYHWDFEVILFREVLWYILPHWASITEGLKKGYENKHILLEISCYDKQEYGLGYFSGPEDIICKFPFEIKEILRHHTTRRQRNGMILVFGKI
jgi:hypothetical protein